MSSAADAAVIHDDWSRLAAIREMPEIDAGRMRRYRLDRIREQMRMRDVALTVLVNPVSMRYAVDFRAFSPFQARFQMFYLFVPVEGPVVMHSGFGQGTSDTIVDEFRTPYDINIFNAGPALPDGCRRFAGQVEDFLRECGARNERVAIEQVNPVAMQALMQRGCEVLDAVSLMEQARSIKSADEIECMRWSIAVAEHAMHKMREVLEPGVTELQLWGVLNYTNLANDGDWHDTRMLASGPRANPWHQEASGRAIEAGDLVAFDTDMVGPFGYCADISRTFFCEPGTPNSEQRDAYGHAYEEIRHNCEVLHPGLTLRELAEQAYRQPEDHLRYSCVAHAVGMSDEYPKIPYLDQWEERGTHCVLEPGMVICIESYVGRRGGTCGVKLEEQVLLTESGTEVLTTFPFEERLFGE